MEYFRLIISEINALNLEHILVFGGGIIPKRDIELLHELGVGRIFTPGSSLDEIPRWLRKELDRD